MGGTRRWGRCAWLWWSPTGGTDLAGTLANCVLVADGVGGPGFVCTSPASANCRSSGSKWGSVVRGSVRCRVGLTRLHKKP